MPNGSSSAVLRVTLISASGRESVVLIFLNGLLIFNSKVVSSEIRNS